MPQSDNIFREVLNIISSEDKWTTKTLAKTQENKECRPLDEKATKWCIEGAFCKAENVESASKSNNWREFSTKIQFVTAYSPYNLNDFFQYHTIKETLEILAKAKDKENEDESK